MSAIRAFLLAALLLASGAALSANVYQRDFTLTNDEGQSVKLSSFSGRTVVMTMEYSKCRFMCTSTFTKLKEIRATADKHNIPLDIVVVSLDPENDTPAEWREYRKMRDLTGRHWHLLTPRKQDMAAIAQILGIKYWYMGEFLLHDFRLLRVGPQGDVIAEMNSYDVDSLRFLR